MPYVDYREIRERVPILDLLERCGWRAESNWGVDGTVRGGCPVHGSRAGSRAFEVQPSRRVWRCWKCGAHGDVVQLAARLWELDQYTAALRLCELFGVDPPLRRV